MASTITVPAQGTVDPEVVTLATQAKADVEALQAGTSVSDLTSLGDITFSAAYGHTISVQTIAEGSGGTLAIQGQAGSTGNAGGDLTLRPGAGASGHDPGFLIMDVLCNGAAAGTMYVVGTGVGTLISMTGNSGSGGSCRMDMAQATATIEGTTTLNLSMGGSPVIGMQSGKLGFFNTAPVVKQTVTGSRGANAALTSLLTALATLGLITDSSS